MKKFATFIVYLTVLSLTFAFGYLMHIMTMVVIHDNQLDELKTEIGVQDAQLAKCHTAPPAAPVAAPVYAPAPARAPGVR